ncbi:hypothetical protein HD554DRAFT_2177419 [Boletus coccyginus]|nr:hypothetical protein HD554DRAFT_2177419 [Boletus coccyginus]
MWFKLHRLHPPWRGSRRTSPANDSRQRIGDPGVVASLTEGVSTIDGRLSGAEPRLIDTHQGAISSVQFLPDGKHIVIGGNDGTVRRWRVEDGSDDASEVGKLVHSEREMSAAVVSKDGKWIILAGNGGRRVTVMDATTHERVVESIDAHEEKITALDVSPDSSKIASGSRDGTVIVWCLETGQRTAGPLKQGRSVLSVRFSPTGDRLASAGSDFSIHVWSIRSDKIRSTTCVPTDPACSLAWSNDGHHLFTGCYRGSILCFDISSSTPAITKWAGHPHSDSVSTLCLSNNGKFIISASSLESSVKIWDVHTQSEILILEHTGEVLDVDISPDDGYLVSGTKNGKTSIWNLRKVLPIPYFFRTLTARLMPSHSDSHPIFTDLSNAAYVSWKKADLVKAEEILSSEIERGLTPLNYHLANRALVRARRQQWDGALEDAQSSLLIKPSLVGLLAKGLAQIGQGEYDTTVEGLDDALERCDQEEKDFVHMVKTIALFDAGYHDEAIRRVNDLIVRSSGVKQPYAFIQASGFVARMYALLAADAMNSQEYTKATSLFVQARYLCPGEYPEMDTLSLISGWVFDGLRLAIYRQSCEASYAARRAQEVLDTIREMENIFRDEMESMGELNVWLTGVKSRCADMLESQGDEAMRGGNYDIATAHYSAALAIAPAALKVATLFAKRSEARAASFLWEDALKDADEAIISNPSSPWGYERKHAALHKLERYGDAIDARKTMISVLEKSPDPQIQRLRDDYINPSDTKIAILEAFRNSVHNSPFRLIDTTSGRLCDAEKRRSIFTEDPIFQELVSSMTTQLHHERIETTTRQYFQYVMLSHRWEAKELELADVLDKSIYELDASPSVTKLQRFCHLARDAKFRWAWSDTCCINKDRDATMVYLMGVPPELVPGALKGSVWMTRGWTLQELLAPPVIRFYYEDWTPYLNDTSLNHKESTVIMQELEDATGVSAYDLLTFHPGLENIRVKLHLASTRETTVPIDMAYGLFGVFGVTMPVIHGESQQHALGRLFQEIVARSGDVTCVAWVGRSSEFNSAFPDHIQVYEHPSRTIPYISEEDMERQVSDLRLAWTHEDEALAMTFYQRLYTLPPAICTNSHLHLPCIIFPVTMLKKVKRSDGVRVYRAMTSALEDTDINTEGRFSSKNPGSEDLVLVCPWIHELLDATPLLYGRRHHPSGEGESPSDSDSEPDSEHEHDATAHDSRCSSVASLSPPVSDPLLPHNSCADQRDFTLKALRLVVRLGQPLGALLLQGQGRGQYRRVATDSDIIIRVRDGVSLDDMVLQTLDIL